MVWCMKKTEVYSWRVDSELKGALEDEARSGKTSVAELLVSITRDWLMRKKSAAANDEAKQRRIRNTMIKLAGSISLDEGPYTNARVREKVAANLKEKRGRNRPD